MGERKGRGVMRVSCHHKRGAPLIEEGPRKCFKEFLRFSERKGVRFR
jgi:hypothetical protein